MELADFTAATTLRKEIDTINALQAKLATAGAKVVLNVVTADYGDVLASHAELSGILGNAYTTIANTALTSLNTQLTNAETTKETAFAALGD